MSKEKDFKSKSTTKTTKKGRRQNYKKGFESEDRDLNRKPTNNRNSSDWICSDGKPTNDPAWYINNPVLSRDVGSIWFSRPTGALLPPTAIYPAATTRNDRYDVGILAIPSVISWGGTGVSGSEGSASINLTAQKLYQYVVHANSRNTTYDKKDLIMSMMAIDAVYAVITEAIRAYRLIAQYDPQNRYVNKLLYALGWNPDNLKSNVAEFRYTINWAISRVNKFFMPSLFDMTKAHIACYDNIYCDRPDMKGQFIVKKSAGIWIYNDAEGCLEYVNQFTDPDTGNTVIWNAGNSVATFKSAINRMILEIEGSQYMGVMQGDLLKAFGMEAMSSYAYVGIDMPIIPVYDQEFNYKLHNADIGGAVGTFMCATSVDGVANSCGMIYRDTDVVDGNILHLSGPTMGNNNTGSDVWSQETWVSHRSSNGSMIDLPATVLPTPENVLLMSLYKVLYMRRDPTRHWHLSDSTPTTCWNGHYMPELLLSGQIFYDPEDMTKVRYLTQDAYNTDIMALMSRFATIPMLAGRDSTATTAPFLFWETNNVTFVDAFLLDRMNDVILWSLWSNSTIANANVSRDTRV